MDKLNLLGEQLSVRVRVDYEGAHLSHVTTLLTLDELRQCLADQGLHIVTAAEKAVLEAANLVLDSSLRRIADENGGCLADWAKAELAKREPKP